MCGTIFFVYIVLWNILIPIKTHSLMWISARKTYFLFFPSPSRIVSMFAFINAKHIVNIFITFIKKQKEIVSLSPPLCKNINCHISLKHLHTHFTRILTLSHRFSAATQSSSSSPTTHRRKTASKSIREFGRHHQRLMTAIWNPRDQPSVVSSRRTDQYKSIHYSWLFLLHLFCVDIETI